MIRISTRALDRLRELAAGAYPREACGVLIGCRVDGDARVSRVSPARNLARTERRFELDPGDLVAAENAARARDEEILAVWHSHPDRPARPSPLDSRALTGTWDQVIVSIDASSTARIGWFHPHAGRWVAVGMRSDSGSEVALEFTLPALVDDEAPARGV